MALRTLIVDDSPVMRRFIRRTMEVSGIEVESYRQACNGQEALDQLRLEPADVVLSDINMPGMDGEQFLRELVADPALRGIPVVVVSTDSTEHRVAQMMALGARGYVRKPFAPEMLRTELERVMGLI
jgi:two-component system chemotaxis response regulator CheY